MEKNIIVSVVMPIYNESKYIDRCIQSLLEQDFDHKSMEWIFVDGSSTDDTVNKLNGYHDQYPELIIIKNNPQRAVPFAMNIGIAAAKGRYIVRMDAHSSYANDYISKSVFYMENSDADNVGGVAETKAESPTGVCIAKMLSSRFGVGNSEFRTNGKTGYVDTVPFGAFRREVFSNYGGFDERLIRNQDNEMNYRIRKNGGKILMSEEIRFSYFCRNSVRDILAMAGMNGMWNVITAKLCPGSMSTRHFIPFTFVMSIFFLSFAGFFNKIFWLLLLLELTLYAVLDIYYSSKLAESIGEWLLLLFLFPAFHISYGLGSLRGIFKAFSKKYRDKSYTPPKL